MPKYPWLTFCHPWIFGLCKRRTILSGAAELQAEAFGMGVIFLLEIVAQRAGKHRLACFW